jgi:hypothetical protein
MRIQRGVAGKRLALKKVLGYENNRPSRKGLAVIFVCIAELL